MPAVRRRVSAVVLTRSVVSPSRSTSALIFSTISRTPGNPRNVSWASGSLGSCARPTIGHKQHRDSSVRIFSHISDLLVGAPDDNPRREDDNPLGGAAKNDVDC